MSSQDKFDSTRQAHPEFLAALDALLSTRAGILVHYVGYAHEPVLRLLLQHLGATFSVTDTYDRFRTGADFFWEDLEDRPGPGRPEWLAGVKFYYEGIPRIDLLLWDTPWRDPEQLFNLLKRRQPQRLLLVDEACSAASHPAYSWTLFPTHALGTLTRQNTDHAL